MRILVHWRDELSFSVKTDGEAAATAQPGAAVAGKRGEAEAFARTVGLLCDGIRAVEKVEGIPADWPAVRLVEGTWANGLTVRDGASRARRVDGAARPIAVDEVPRRVALGSRRSGEI